MPRVDLNWMPITNLLLPGSAHRKTLGTAPLAVARFLLAFVAKRTASKPSSPGTGSWAECLWKRPRSLHKRTKRPQPNPQAEAKPVSVEGVITAFLADTQNRVGGETQRGYRKYLLPVAARYGKRSAENLTVSEAEAYVRKPAWSSTYRANVLSTLITAFRWAERERLISRSPLHGLRKPARASRGAKAIVSTEAHDRLVQHARQPFRAFLQLLWVTGARPGEIAGLRAGDIDLAQSVAVLTEHKTAHLGKVRVLYLFAEAIAVLRERIAHSPEVLLFPGEDGLRMTPQAIGCRLRRLCIKAGVNHCIAYGFRHAFATDALANGVPDAQVAALMGHSGTAMLHKHYAHLGARAKALREALHFINGKKSLMLR
jgi:integrase/recombinase XerC